MEAHARIVMAKGALDRLADPKFPHELRLQIMKEGVAEWTTWWHIAHDTIIEELRQKLYKSVLFPFWDHSRAKYAAVKYAAEEAFLENVIFKVEASGNVAAPLLASIGDRLRYLDLSTYVNGYRSSQQDASEDQSCSMITKSMSLLKSCFPNLKACVLTLNLLIEKHSVRDFLRPSDSFEEQLLRLRNRRGRDDQTNIAVEVEELFEAFATRGPGKLQFVRVRCARNKGVYAPPFCGPLFPVAGIMETESQDGSLGKELLKRAYKLVRTTPKPVEEQKKYNPFESEIWPLRR
jgi:hypothetical protein